MMVLLELAIRSSGPQREYIPARIVLCAVGSIVRQPIIAFHAICPGFKPPNTSSVYSPVTKPAFCSLHGHANNVISYLDGFQAFSIAEKMCRHACKRHR